MTLHLDERLANAAFSSPNCDGSFTPDFAEYLNDLGAMRPSVVLAFAPKAAGTFLRSAAIAAIGGALVRTVHAQGGRDASFYLPTFLLYYAGNYPPRPLVTHVHMQALPANRHFIEALDLKPVIMIRAIPDMLASYADMLEAAPHAPDNWLNIRLPQNYAALSPLAKNDFLIDMIGPWYASYFATWLEYAGECPGRVCILDYDRFVAEPAAALETLLAHAGLSRPRAACQVALDAVWDRRADFRFHKGVSGRGKARFTPEQMTRLGRQLDFYSNLAAIRDRLIPPSASLPARALSGAA
jgi:hypothetical protein